MSSSLETEFGAFRAILWPIHRHEKKKLVPMLIMFCLIVFCYDLLRNMKDAVIIPSAGAEAIPFIKFGALLPGAFLLTYLFIKLTNQYSQEKVFYIIITSFLVFFLFFGFVLYPMRHSLHAHGLANFLEGVLPVGFKGFASMVRHWSYTLFYVMAELWSSIVMTVLFWGFANEVTRIDEARRFFGVFCFGANCFAIMAGLVSLFLPQEKASAALVREDWTMSLMILTSIVTVAGFAVMAIFRWMNKNVLNDPSFDELHNSKRAMKAKTKLSFKESFSFLSNSRYLICIAVIVFSYNLVINLVELFWKDQLGRLYPSTDDYFAFMSIVTASIGFVSALMSLLMASIITRFGWTWTALITPIIMLITSAGFFSFVLYRTYVGEQGSFLLGLSPLWLAVMFGAVQNCMSKAMKYSVFDGTKEMAFIPLSHESKLKGKAAIDGVGSRMGKSGGSLIHTGLLMMFGSLTESATFVPFVLFIVIGIWIVAIRSLGRKFNALIDSPPSETEVESQTIATAI